MALVAETDNERRVLEFLAAWSESDVGLLLPYFHDDAVWTDLPYATYTGIDEIRAFIDLSFQTLRLDIEVLNLASRGDVVFTERIEHLEFFEPARRGDFPLAGVMQLRDGRIARWTEYFDGRTVEGTKADVWLQDMVRDPGR